MLPRPQAAPTRREFLSLSAAAAASTPLLARAGLAGPAPRAQRILMLGGTGFLGPAIVQCAIDRGHQVTLFNRGRTDPGLFPELEQLRGNRRRPMRDGMPEQDLAALAGRDWDVVIDTSGYFTRNVEDTAKLLADHVAHYVFVSSLSAYRDMEKNDTPVSEDSPLATCDDKYTWDMGPAYENYGALKAYCEQAVEQFLPGRGTYIRPGYICGPRDSSDRFTWWPMRIARGGECLAPGNPDAEQQIIDVRDLGEFIVHCAEQRLAGPFNCNGFKGRISTAELLHTMKGTLNHECSFTWVDDAFLEAEGLESWGSMPCWVPPARFNHSANDKAIAAGLRFRPIAETIRATYDWARAERPADRPWRAGLTEERERELLAKWKQRGR
ncbi:MAG: NAD-dependent epimerase/dehydratase family protein [Planctomycetes bacterium]|nr:NAD-dependent epimerase/dehydratase family protein [Planctomycetota bacterium]